MQPPTKVPRLDGLPSLPGVPAVSMLGAANPLGTGALGLPGVGGVPGLTGLPGLPGVPNMPGMPGGLAGSTMGNPAMAAGLSGGTPGGLPKIQNMMQNAGLVYANMAAAAAMTLASMGQDDDDDDSDDAPAEAPAAFDKDLLAQLAKRAAEQPMDQATVEPVAPQPVSTASSANPAAALLASATGMTSAVEIRQSSDVPGPPPDPSSQAAAKRPLDPAEDWPTLPDSAVPELYKPDDPVDLSAGGALSFNFIGSSATLPGATADSTGMQSMPMMQMQSMPSMESSSLSPAALQDATRGLEALQALEAPPPPPPPPVSQGTRACPKCGEECLMKHRFCPSCGFALPPADQAAMEAVGGDQAKTVSLEWSSRSQQEPEGVKKDASSVANLLAMVQDNVARGRAGGGAKKMEPTLQQAFGMSGERRSASPPSNAMMQSTIAAFEAVSQRLESASASSAESCRALEADVLDLLPNLEPARASELVARAHASEAMRSTEFLDDISQAIQQFVPKMSSPHLTRVMGTLAAWAMATSGAAEEDFGGVPAQAIRLSEDVRVFFAAAAKEASIRLMDVQPADLCRIASSLASVGLGEPWLFSSVARAAAARSERFSAPEIVALASSFDKASLVHTALFEALSRSMRAGFRDVSQKELLVGMRALATCAVRDKDMGHAVCAHLLKIAQQGELPAEEFCSLAWTFCALDLYHDRMFRAVFRSLEDAAVVPSETLCQLYEIHITLKAFHYESYKEYILDAETVQGLCDHYKKHKGGRKWEYKPERATEKTHKDVAETLQDVVEGCSVYRQHQTALGFTVDVAALRRKNSSALIVVDVDGPSTLMRSLDPSDARQAGAAWRVRGAVMLKRRVLQRHGFRIAVVTEDIWRTLEDSKEKRDFLREVMKHAGISADRLR